jgi:hypothetical protein
MEYWGVDCSSRSAGIAIPDMVAKDKSLYRFAIPDLLL